ncbi:hypothetical protein [Scytonema sp. NUACC26]|uniref:hypothetical protein n=1 Tax=Scytonema sp. NUACC26 TaxID=3140176 RepID=UPI0034DC46C3
MTKHKHSALNVLSFGALPSILIILVLGSLGLAVIDEKNRPAYFDIVKVAVDYSFGAMKLQDNENSEALSEEDAEDSLEQE